VGHNPKK